MLTDTAALARAGLDGVAVKPTEVGVRRAADLGVDAVTVDYEGNEYVPSAATLADLAGSMEVRVTTPVRADGFDPLGDDSRDLDLPDSVGRVLIAGNPAYLSEAETRRPIAPRLREALSRAPDAWVGTEGIERVALAVGGTQFELLSASTERDLRALRAGGFEGELAVYAPTVLTADEDAVIDAVGAYAARRRPVRESLPDGAATDASATGRAREVLLEGVREYALVGDIETVRERVARLRDAGADHVVGYPARGIDAFGG
jgi:hypothetical protein